MVSLGYLAFGLFAYVSDGELTAVMAVAAGLLIFLGSTLLVLVTKLIGKLISANRSEGRRIP